MQATQFNVSDKLTLASTDTDTDSGFTEAISTLLGTDVMFTEQGMQDNGYASMEL